MSLAGQIFSPIGALLDRIVCIVFAVVFAQGPVYIAQYLDVLAGARMESEKNLRKVQEQAEDNGVTVEDFVSRLLGNSDPLVRSSGETIQNLLVSYEQYESAYSAISTANVWQKPFRLIQHFDPSIGEALVFNPSVPLSIEGAVYAFIGLIIGWLLFSLIASIFKRRKPKPASGGQ